jgi:protein arginine kinase
MPSGRGNDKTNGPGGAGSGGGGGAGGGDPASNVPGTPGSPGIPGSPGLPGNGEGASIPPSPVGIRLDYASGTEWLRSEGESSDVVISSRVRLARNLAGHVFANRADVRERAAVVTMCRDAIIAGGLASASAGLAPSQSPGAMFWIDLHESSQVERILLVERHLISKQLAKGRPEKGGEKPAGIDDPRGVAFLVPSERVSIMVNEEDHLRIQVVRSGFQLADAWGEINEIDDRLADRLAFAYSSRFGYLTACPTNVGTGLRMSVMLHLPALKLTGDIEKVKKAANDMNLAVRGFYGEGSDAIGDFYQLSNQTTLGKTEPGVLQELGDQIIPQVIEYERLARRTLLTKRHTALEDQVYRAIGILKNARLLGTEESMTLISNLRLGVCLGLVPGLDLRAINHLMLLVQPAHLQRAMGKDMDQDQRRVARASLVRAKLGA